MTSYTRKRSILVKSEETYNTNPLFASSDALLVDSLEVSPLEMDLKERETLTGDLGNRDSIVARRTVPIKFGVELTTSGTPGTPPRWGPVIKACGFTETIVANTSVAYTLSGSPATFSSVGIDFRNDLQRQRILGVRGTVSLEMSNDEVPHLMFDMMGIYAVPTAINTNTTSFSNQAAPLAMNSDNTSNVSVHGYSACMSAFSMQLANEMVFRQLAGCSKQVMLPNRKPSGELTIELPDLDDVNFFDIASGQTKDAIQWVHTDASGGTITFNAPMSAIGSPSYEDADGIQHLKLPFRPIPDEGNDEFSIVLAD
jgi:hypothetical protein